MRLEYDPDQITYEQLLEAFFAMHDPTQWNRQGPDVGSQYRSAIFYHSPEQERAARDAVRRIEQSGRLRRPIVTQIVAAGDVVAAPRTTTRSTSRSTPGTAARSDGRAAAPPQRQRFASSKMATKSAAVGTRGTP